jgi:hypothetical protein
MPIPRTLYGYRTVETIGDRHCYRYQGPWGWRRLPGEDLQGWDVLVRTLWERPARVYAAPPGTARPGRPKARAGKS